MARIPIALQLYSIREDLEEDFPGNLKAVAEMGYEGVEFAGYYDYTAEELKEMLDDLGLAVAGSHVRVDAIQPDGLRETADFALALGNKYVVVPGLPGEYTESKAAWQKTAELFSEAAENLKAQGLMLGYHNHRSEFETLHEGERAWDIFFDAASEDVFAQLDIGHALRGGGDAVEALQKYPGRFATVHIKDFDPDDDGALVGDGVAPWEEIFELCETSGGTEWYIVEHEVYPVSPMECVQRCLENMKKMGK